MDIKNPDIEGFNKICRLCLQETPTLINIFFCDAANLISSVANIEPKEGDLLPENICISCMDRTSEFYTFKLQCEKNHELLEATLKFGKKEANNSKQITLTNRNGQKIEIKRNLSELIPLEDYEAVKHDQTEDSEKIENIQTFKLMDQKPDVNVDQQIVDHKRAGIENPTCEHCNKDFPNLKLHNQTCHPSDGQHYCHLCKQIDTKMSSSFYDTVKKLQAHLRYHSYIQKHRCPECQKTFKTTHQKLVHMTSHTEERPVICHLCQKTFKHNTYLAVHLKSHTGNKPYKCDTCNKRFLHKFSLKVHKKCHVADREHMCPLCAKTFKHGFNLTIHMRQHTGEKPYSCQQCFKSFKSASILNSHMVIHSDSKRFQCESCDKRFKRSGDLKIHMRSHTGFKPYACAICGNKYKMASHLSEHTKTHSGEKNYVCEICSKQFYNNRSLQIHKKVHSGEKEFACDVCGKLFVHYTSLCAHVKRHKGPNIKSEIVKIDVCSN